MRPMKRPGWVGSKTAQARQFGRKQGTGPSSKSGTFSALAVDIMILLTNAEVLDMTSPEPDNRSHSWESLNRGRTTEWLPQFIYADRQNRIVRGVVHRNSKFVGVAHTLRCNFRASKKSLFGSVVLSILLNSPPNIQYGFDPHPHQIPICMVKLEILTLNGEWQSIHQERATIQAHYQNFPIWTIWTESRTHACVVLTCLSNKRKWA